MNPTSRDRQTQRTWEPALLKVLCLVAGVRIFLCAAATPFFANMDEQDHYDLVGKYARGYWPTPDSDSYDTESAALIVLYGSPEYFHRLAEFPNGKVPLPLWTRPDPLRDPVLERGIQEVSEWVNNEAFSPPVYYLMAGGWYDLGKLLGFHGGALLYWIRFLNVLLYPLLMVVSWFFLRRFYPEQVFLRVGVLLLLTFFPQDVFGSINSDTLSPLLFVVSLFLLLEWRSRDRPSFVFGGVTGLAAAATVLVKYTNLAILVLFAAALVARGWRVTRAGQLKQSGLALGAAALAAGAPVFAWLLRNYMVFGDAAGTAKKTVALGWSYKPFSEWGNHPLFTMTGLHDFWSELFRNYWGGEMIWHREPTTPDWAGQFFAWTSALLLLAGTVRWCLSRRWDPNTQQTPDGWLLIAVGVSILLLMALSLPFDFGECVNPSRDRPYFVSGRLIIGMLVPFLILQVRGLEFIFAKQASKLGPGLVVLAMAIMMVVAKLDFLLLVSHSPYNWFHLP